MRDRGLGDEVRSCSTARRSRTASQAIGYKEIIGASPTAGHSTRPSTPPSAAPGPSPGASGCGSGETPDHLGWAPPTITAPCSPPCWQPGAILSGSSLSAPSCTGPGTTSSSRWAPDRGRDADVAVQLCDRRRGSAPTASSRCSRPGRRRLRHGAAQRRREPRRDERQRHRLPLLGRASAPASATGRASSSTPAADAARSSSTWTGRRRARRRQRRHGTGDVRAGEDPARRAPPLDLEVTFHGVTYHGDAAGMGNPHFVLLVDDPEATRRPTRTASRDRRSLPAPHERRVHRGHRADALTMRVWERGVGETLSCGTGACAPRPSRTAGLVAPCTSASSETHVTVGAGARRHSTFHVDLARRSAARPARHVFDTGVSRA